MSKMRKIGRYVTHSDDCGLKSTLERAQLLQRFSLELQSFLSPPLCQHIHFANIRDNFAVLTVDDAAWLTNARYEAPAILKFIKQKLDLNQISKIQFKVAFRHDPPIKTSPHRLTMSQQTAELLLSASEGITEPDLKTALKQLAKRGQQKS